MILHGEKKTMILQKQHYENNLSQIVGGRFMQRWNSKPGEAGKGSATEQIWCPRFQYDFWISPGISRSQDRL